MLIQIHAIQNHSPANLNRDDLGAPKTCYFGGVLRSRISSQCLKRSIRLSPEFAGLLGGIRTRQLAKLIAVGLEDDPKARKRAEDVLKACGFLPKKAAKATEGEDEATSADKSKALVYTTRSAVDAMTRLFREGANLTVDELARRFAEMIASDIAVPDMALSGRMLEPDKSAKDTWKGLDTTVEAALQVAHAISTHEAKPEVDYYVAADDIPGEDAGAGFLDEAMYAAACFYKYLSIDWDQLCTNLAKTGEKAPRLAAHTVGALLNAAALTTPSGKQNSYAAHNPPDGIIIEIRDTPISYANAFAKPVEIGPRDITSQSITQLASYAHDLDVGFGRPTMRLWFSPNLRYRLAVGDDEPSLADQDYRSLDELVQALVAALGFDWKDVAEVGLAPSEA